MSLISNSYIQNSPPYDNQSTSSDEDHFEIEYNIFKTLVSNLRKSTLILYKKRNNTLKNIQRKKRLNSAKTTL